MAFPAYSLVSRGRAQDDRARHQLGLGRESDPNHTIVFKFEITAVRVLNPGGNPRLEGVIGPTRVVPVKFFYRDFRCLRVAVSAT